MKPKRQTFFLGEREARLVAQLARQWRVSERDVLRLAVWAYLVPMAPTLAPPIAGPLTVPKLKGRR